MLFINITIFTDPYIKKYNFGRAALLVDEAEINFGFATLYGRMAARPSRQIAFLVTPTNCGLDNFITVKHIFFFAPKAYTTVCRQLHILYHSRAVFTDFCSLVECIEKFSIKSSL